MTWLAENWLLLLLVLCCVGMMLFMHGGHGKSDKESEQHKH